MDRGNNKKINFVLSCFFLLMFLCVIPVLGVGLTKAGFNLSIASPVSSNGQYLLEPLNTEVPIISQKNQNQVLEQPLVDTNNKYSVTIFENGSYNLEEQDLLSTSNKLVAYYSFDDGTAKDSSGYGKSGTVYGAKSVSGLIGKALQFNGKSDFVSLPNLYAHNPEAVTYMALIKPGIQKPTRSDVWEDKGMVFFNGRYHSVLGVLYSKNVNAGLKLQQDKYSNTWYGVSSSTIIPTNENTWTHIAGVIDTKTHKVKIFINGKLEKSASFPEGKLDDEFDRGYFVSIGVYDSIPYGRKEYYNGVIDEVRIYEGALSDQEILSQYNSYFKQSVTIEKIVPTYSYQGQMCSFTLTGSNFKKGMSIELGKNDLLPIKGVIISTSPKKMEGFFVIPSNATLGLWDINLKDKNGVLLCFKNEIFNILPKTPIPTSAQLVAYYSFDDGTAKDNSGKRNDGFLQGTKPTPGVKRNALSFNGKSDYISLPKIFTSNPKKITMMAWVKAKTDQKPQKIFYNGDYESALSINKDPQGNFNIGVKLSKDGSRNTWYSAKTNVTLNQEWIHISGVIDTENHLIKVFQNGILINQNSLPKDTFYLPKDGRVRIGAYESSIFGLKEFFEGDIDEFRIYKGSLTDEEIKTIYESYNYGPFPTPIPTGSPTPTTSPTPTPDPNPLEASFTATPITGNAPLNVQFKDTSNGNPTSWGWTFGDGGSSIKQNPIHLYRKGGSYPVKLVIRREGKTSQVIMSNYIIVSSKTSKNFQFVESTPIMRHLDTTDKSFSKKEDSLLSLSINPPQISVL